MPSTNLPLSTALKGTAGFRYFPEGSTDRPEAVHALSWPPELVPQGGLRVDKSKTRSVVTSLDQKQTEHWNVGGSSGVETIQLRIRFDGWPDSLLNMLDDAADGATLDYYPRLASTNLKFPSKLLGVDNVGVNEDEDRFGHAEWEADVTLKDASSDNQGYWWLRSPNKLRNPRLAIGTTDGVAEHWQSAESGSSFSIDSSVRAQKIRLTSTESGSIAVKSEKVFGALPGDTWTLSAEVRVRNISTAETFLRIDGDAGFSRTQVTSTTFERLSVSTTGIGSSGNVRALFRIRDPSTGSTGTGEAWIRDARLTFS